MLARGLLAATMGLASAPAVAQTLAARAEASGQAPANLPLATVLTPGGGSPAAQFILDASAKDKVGTFAIGWRTGHGHTQLSFSGPLNSDQVTEPVSLTGLSKGATGKIEFNRLNWKAPTPEELKKATDVCVRIDVPLNQCSYRQLLVAGREEAALIGQYTHVNARPWIVGGSFSATKRTFEFLVKDTLADDSKEKTGVTATGRIGVFSSTFGFLIASGTYRKDFRAGDDPAEICQPIPGTSATRCEEVVVGGPNPSDKKLLTVEVRRLFVAGGGVAPQVAYDFRNDRWLADVPVYFVPGKGNVTGGVKFTWRSDTRAVGAVVFIGTALELF